MLMESPPFFYHPTYIQSPPTHSFQLFNLLLRLQLPKLCEEGEVGREGPWLKEVQETEELVHAVLEGSACQQYTVLLCKCGRERGREIGKRMTYHSLTVFMTLRMTKALVGTSAKSCLLHLS